MRLLPGEELGLALSERRAAHDADDLELDARYMRGDVRIVTEQARYPLNTIHSLLAGGQYELQPNFQRRRRWDDAKKSRLIESFIMNVPIPPIFLYEDRFSHYEVMDGLQRLTAINDFYNDRFQLTGLEQWPELNGRRYTTLPDQVRAGVDRRYLSSIILLHETAKDPYEAQRLKQLVFERINSGGVKLEPQESRNAIYDGPLNRLCIRLARNPDLCETWGIPAPLDDTLFPEEEPEELLENDLYSKMFDVELVLRFFAYRQRLDYQSGALKQYLDTFLRVGNTFSPQVMTEYETIFTKTIHLVAQTFGPGAFWLWRKRASGWYWYQRPTTVVYDPMMFAFSQNLDREGQIAASADQLREGVKSMYEEHYADFEGRYTNLSNIRDRNDLFMNLVQSVLG